MIKRSLLLSIFCISSMQGYRNFWGPKAAGFHVRAKAPQDIWVLLEHPNFEKSSVTYIDGEIRLTISMPEFVEIMFEHDEYFSKPYNYPIELHVLEDKSIEINAPNKVLAKWFQDISMKG